MEPCFAEAGLCISILDTLARSRYHTSLVLEMVMHGKLAEGAWILLEHLYNSCQSHAFFKNTLPLSTEMVYAPV